MKRLLFASLTLFALAHTAPAQNVTFDVTCTYPANFATSHLTAPNAAFLIEFTVPQVVPATPPNTPLFFQTTLIAASYTFKGVTHPAPATSSFFHSDSAGNLEEISLPYSTGTFVLSSSPVIHAPSFVTRSGSKAVFLLGDLGAGRSWHVDYSPNGAPHVTNPVTVTDVVSRPATVQ